MNELLSKRDGSKRRMLDRGRMQQSDGTEEMVAEYLANKRPLLLGMWRQKRIRKNCDSIVMKFTQRRIDSEQQNSHEHKHYRHFYYFIITIKNTNIWIQTQVDCCLCILQMMLYCILIHPLCSLSIVIYEAVDWLFLYLLSNIRSLQKVRDNLSVVDKYQYEKWKTIIEIEATSLWTRWNHVKAQTVHTNSN